MILIHHSHSSSCLFFNPFFSNSLSDREAPNKQDNTAAGSIEYLLPYCLKSNSLIMRVSSSSSSFFSCNLNINYLILNEFNLFCNLIIKLYRNFPGL